MLGIGRASQHAPTSPVLRNVLDSLVDREGARGIAHPNPQFRRGSVLRLRHELQIALPLQEDLGDQRVNALEQVVRILADKRTLLLS